MIDKIRYLDDGDTKYPMAFTVNVMEETEEQYGGIEAWAKFMDKKEPSYKALKFMVLSMINEGIDIENERLSSQDKKEMLTSKQVGRLITRVGFDKIGLKIFEIIQKSLPKDNQPKNALATKNLAK